MAVAIKMPKLSPTMETGALSGWLVKVGDVVKPESVIAEIETDKAVMEVEALVSGSIGYLCPIEKQELPVNSIIGFILEEGETAPQSWEEHLASIVGSVAVNPTKSEEKPETKAQVKAEEVVVNHNQERIFASPLAKKIAKDSGIDLNDLVPGSGPRGRVIKSDVENYAPTNTKTLSQTSAAPQSYEVPMNRMRKVIADRLTQAKQEIPHIYMQKKVYMDAVEAMKANFVTKFDKKISMTPFFIKAIALALKENPVLNRTFENGKIMQHNEYNISIAIAVENGIVVPVIRNADRKSLLEIANELSQLSSLAKEGKLKPEHSTGGTFSISNLGMFAVDSFQAIINPPQVAIIAIASTGIEAAFDGANFIPRKVTKCEVSCDHRVVDGADAARFMQSFAKYMENPEGMLL